MEAVHKVLPFKVVGEVVKASLKPMHPQLAERADRNAAADLLDDEDEQSTAFEGFGKGRSAFGSAKEGVPSVRLPLRRRKHVDASASLESLERMATASSALYNSLPFASSLEEPSPDSARVPPEFKAAVQALDGGAAAPARREALEQMLAHAHGGNASQRDFIAVGALTRVVQALGDADAECRRLAAVTVWALCFRNGPAARHLGSTGAAEALVGMLGEGSAELLEAATGALCVLALPPANLMGCINAGAVDALVGVLLGRAPPADCDASGAPASSSDTGAGGSGGHASPQAAGRAPGAKPASAGAAGAAAAPSEAARRLAASALGNLARVETVRQRLAGDEGVRSALAGMVGGEEDDEAGEAARQVLARLVGTEERVLPRRRSSSGGGVMA